MSAVEEQMNILESVIRDYKIAVANLTTSLSIERDDNEKLREEMVKLRDEAPIRLALEKAERERDEAQLRVRKLERWIDSCLDIYQKYQED